MVANADASMQEADGCDCFVCSFHLGSISFPRCLEVRADVGKSRETSGEIAASY
jgi:hypothetical protein